MVQDATPSLLHGGKVACLRRGLLLWFPGERDTSAVPWKPTLACVAASVEMGHEELMHRSKQDGLKQKDRLAAVSPKSDQVLIQAATTAAAFFWQNTNFLSSTPPLSQLRSSQS